MTTNEEKFEALPDFATVTETAEFLGVSRATVRRFAKCGDLSAWRTESGQRRIDKDSIGRLCGFSGYRGPAARGARPPRD